MALRPVRQRYGGRDQVFTGTRSHQGSTQGPTQGLELLWNLVLLGLPPLQAFMRLRTGSCWDCSYHGYTPEAPWENNGSV